MTQDKEIKAVISELDKLARRRALISDCDKLYCTTCGGLAYYADKNMDRLTRARLEVITQDADFDDFSKFGYWQEYVRQKFSHQYYSTLQTTFDIFRAGLDHDDPRDFDEYFISLHRFYNKKIPEIRSLLVPAIKLALETKNASLIETLILVLGEDSERNYPELVELAVKKSKDYEPLKRTLYNKLRSVRKDVRDYVGDGTTVYHYGS